MHLQVEGLCAMVEGVRELVDTAEQITSAEFVRPCLPAAVGIHEHCQDFAPWQQSLPPNNQRSYWQSPRPL